MNRVSPGDSPSRESPATPNLATVSGTSHDWLANTLREPEDSRNGKIDRFCEEVVEEGIFLWKGMEKWGGNYS
jgi:hypothetical protein